MDLPLAAGPLQSRPNDFTAERNAILSEIDGYLSKILTLKTQLNTFTHINQLPSEILGQILVTYARDHYRSAISRWDKSIYTSPGWIKLAHVCRHWRDVALGTPRFWSYVLVQRPRTFCALLPLSKSSPLYIDLTLEPSVWAGAEAWNSVMDLIGQHSHRLREFRYAAASKQVRMLAERLGPPMCLLEKLVLHCNSKGPEADNPEPLHLLPATEHTLRLYHLEIRQLPVPWTDAVFCPTLTTLIVVWPKATSRDTRPSIGTFDQLLDALQAMAPSLVHLTLEECITSIQPLTSEPSLPKRSISLTSLERLQMGGKTSDCAFLMDHLSVNPTAKVTVSGVGASGIQRLVEILSDHVSRSTPLLALQVFFPHSTVVTILGFRSASPGALGGEAIHLTLRNSLLDVVRERPLTTVLKAAKTLFSRVRALAMWSDEEVFDVNWPSVFSRMFSVETFSIASHPGRGFFKALCNVRRVQRGQTWATIVPLIRLRELKLEDTRFHHSIWNYEHAAGGDFFEQLLDWAILRCNYGVPLERMQVRECKYVTATDVHRIRDVIVDVEWDQWERESTEEDDEDKDYDSDGFPW